MRRVFKGFTVEESYVRPIITESSFYISKFRLPQLSEVVSFYCLRSSRA